MAYPKPLSYYTKTENNPILFHLLDVGEGLMILLVYPDKTTMLYDCNVRENHKDSIIEYLKRWIPKRYNSDSKEDEQWIDVFVNSHRDLDHYRGLRHIKKEFEIRSIWDSGQAGETTDDKDYNYYMQLRRDVKEKYGESALFVPSPSKNYIKEYGGVEIFCLCSSKFAEDFEKAKIQHTNAIVLSLHYGGRSILLTSDSDWKAWKEKIVPNFKDTGLLDTNIFVASHHGSRSFFTDEQKNEHIDIENNPDTTYIESMDYIKPSIVLISCGDYKEFHHPNKEAIRIYKKYAPQKQVYTTKKNWNLMGFIDSEGAWTVVPERFVPKGHNKFSFDINCFVDCQGRLYVASSGDAFPIESNLEFKIVATGGLLDPFSEIDIWWEVSNGGINDNHESQEIYYRGDDEKYEKTSFRRAVAYEGRHLLRCRVKNKKKKVDLTRIFVVNGEHQK